MGEEIVRGISLEFTDGMDVTNTTRLIVRLVLACILGSLIGLQRERSGKAAGLRTHMLVCIGTAFVMAVPERAGMQLQDMSRVIQGVMSGIGFLGVGTIIKFEKEGRIEGLTTAATIWFTAAIGIAVGMGREASALIATILALSILSILPGMMKDDMSH